MTTEIKENLNGLKASISGLSERRRSAGRRMWVKGLAADAEELAGVLRSGLLERASHDIMLEDRASDYRELAACLEAMQGVTLKKASPEEEEACRQLDEAMAALTEVLLQIAAQLERHHTKEEYARLYEAEKQHYMASHKARAAREKYEDWLDNECYVAPTLEDVEDYRVERLVRLFEKGVLNSKAAHIRRGEQYKGEIDFTQVDDDKPIKKNIYKYYAVLRKLVDWEDGYLQPDDVRIGQYFYAARNEENAKENRSDLLKYLHKIHMVQQERRQLLQPDEAAGPEESQLNYFAPEKNLKVLLSEEWFEKHRTDKQYDHRWTNDFVNALMASEHRDYIAREWAKGKRQDYIRGCVLGLLKEGGVIRGSMDSIARSAGVCENYRTFSKYMGMCQQVPFAQWAQDYICPK